MIDRGSRALEIGEVNRLFGFDIRNRPEFRTIGYPMDDVIATRGRNCFIRCRAAVCWPDKQVNEVFVFLIPQRGNRLVFNYQNGDAESWINLHQISAEVGLGFDFAITLAGTRTPGRELDPTETGHLIGAISI
jgi:hypothetical protein